MRSLALVLSILLLTFAAHGRGPAPESVQGEPEGEERLYVFTPDRNDPRYLSQSVYLGEYVRRRGLTVFEIIGEDTVLVDGVPVQGISAQLLRREHGVPLQVFRVLLLGPKGRWESGEPVDLRNLFPRLEDVPLRRRELRRNWL